MQDKSLLSSEDLYLFNEGRHFRLYQKLGAQPRGDRTHFCVWAPEAAAVAVRGDFNDWSYSALTPLDQSGLWAGQISGAQPGHCYKYEITGRDKRCHSKSDPFGFYHKSAPDNASIIHPLAYHWGDQDWLQKRPQIQNPARPLSIYEMHLPSWRPGLTYRTIAAPLIAWLRETGFTHVEFMPVMEHPFGGSWGYQITGYYAPTSRLGSPQDFMYLIDQLHQAGIGVILDWVPAHFPDDPHGLAVFDGSCLFEHLNPQQGRHPEWHSCIYNYDRAEVRSFLISNALFWLDHYHIDALRVDAVASMLYLDYGRKEGAWIPNCHGGRENLGAIKFLRELTIAVHEHHPGIRIIAEESTAWPQVTGATVTGGLGFDYKWDMGWMNDTLRYFARDPAHRAYHHHEICFRASYAHNENHMLALSHDEVVHGKGALLAKMPGDDWQKFANLRALYSYMYGCPGKKLLFMGNEFAQRREWDHDGALSWDLLAYDPHKKITALIAVLNHLYRHEPALQNDLDPSGFAWIDGADHNHSILSFLRICAAGKEKILCVFNLTPMPHHDYRIGVPASGPWREILNSDDKKFGGSHLINPHPLCADDIPWHGQPYSLALTLPPLGGIFLSCAP